MENCGKYRKIVDIDIPDSPQKNGFCIFPCREKIMRKPKSFPCNGVHLYLPMDSSAIIFLNANNVVFHKLFQ